jgi:hypothetical protein
METKVMSATTKGLIIGLVLVTLSIATYFLVSDMSKQQSYAWISYVLIVGGAMWACFSYAKEMNGDVTFGSVFGHGFKTTAVFTSIVLVYTIIAVTVLFPEMKDKVMEAARLQMEKDNKLSETQIDQAISMTSKFFVPFAIGGVLIGYLILGAIGSLIGAAVAKKNPKPAPFQ